MQRRKKYENSDEQNQFIDSQIAVHTESTFIDARDSVAKNDYCFFDVENNKIAYINENLMFKGSLDRFNWVMSKSRWLELNEDVDLLELP